MALAVEGLLVEAPERRAAYASGSGTGEPVSEEFRAVEERQGPEAFMEVADAH